MKQLSNKSNKNSNYNVTIQENSLNNYFSNFISNQKLGLMARQSGWKERASDFKFAKFVKSFIGYLANARNCTIYGGWINYREHSNDDICYKPFHNKIRKDQSVAFMMDVAQKLMSTLLSSCVDGKGQMCLKLLKAHGLEINDIICYDGTYWTVNESLADSYKGVRSANKEYVEENIYDENGTPVTNKKKCAQAGLQTEYSVVKKMFTKVTLTPAVANEKDYVEVDISSPRLYLMDAGYNKLELLQKINDSGSLYITKARANCAAIIKHAYINGKEIEHLKERKLSDKDAREFRPHSTIDLDVEFKNGTKARIIRFKAAKKEFALMLTNIKRSVLSCNLVSDIYRLRWQIELEFKQLKSGNNLLGVNTKDENIMKLFIIGSLCACIVKRLAILCLSTLTPNKSISFYRVNMYCDWIKTFINEVFARNYNRLKKQLKNILENISAYIMAKQSNSKHLLHKTMDSIICNLAKSLMEKGLQLDFFRA